MMIVLVYSQSTGSQADGKHLTLLAACAICLGAESGTTRLGWKYVSLCDVGGARSL